MKSVKRDKGISNKKYPKLMFSGYLVVLMTGESEQFNEGTGVVVHCDDSENLGEFSETWNLEAFTDYDGEIILINE